MGISREKINTISFFSWWLAYSEQIIIMFYRELTEEDLRLGQKINSSNAWIFKEWDGVSYPVALSCFEAPHLRDIYGEEWHKYLVLHFDKYEGFRYFVVEINHLWFPNTEESSYLIEL